MSEESTNIPFEMASVAILKNNQERENETPVIQAVLPEAMLISCLNTRSGVPSQTARPLILVCGIPADKKRASTRSKVPKSEETKGKSKSVSYSTQLSFESEDEYYDPLFSVPSVFHGFNSPLKDAFSKSGSEKSDETKLVKDAEVVQCLSIEENGCDDLEVSQVIPYNDGSHVLFVLTKRKQCCTQDASAKSRDKTISDGDNSGTSVDNCDDRDDEGYDRTTSEGSVSTSNGIPFDAKENCDSKELSTDVDNKFDSRLESGRSDEEANSNSNIKYLVETNDTENFAEGLQTSGSTNYPEDISDMSQTGPAETQKQTSGDNQVMNENTVNNSESEPKLAPTENTTLTRSCSVCLLLYKTRIEKGRTLLEERPCKSLFTMSNDGLSDVFLLPDDAEDSFMPSSVEVNDVKNVYLAGLFVCFQ